MAVTSDTPLRCLHCRCHTTMATSFVVIGVGVGGGSSTPEYPAAATASFNTDDDNATTATANNPDGYPLSSARFAIKSETTHMTNQLPPAPQIGSQIL